MYNKLKHKVNNAVTELCRKGKMEQDFLVFSTEEDPSAIFEFNILSLPMRSEHVTRIEVGFSAYGGCAYSPIRANCADVLAGEVDFTPPFLGCDVFHIW